MRQTAMAVCLSVLLPCINDAGKYSITVNAFNCVLRMAGQSPFENLPLALALGPPPYYYYRNIFIHIYST